MHHLNFEFEADPGDVAEVTLDRAANVLLMEPPNYSSYQEGRAYHYEGGYSTESPVQFAVPKRGHWHVVVDLGGGPGQVRASVRLLSGAPA
jgi:hypothetical protein